MGWVQCPVIEPFAPQGASGFRVKKVGSQVFMEWGIAATGVTVPSQAYTVSTLPDPKYYPNQTEVYMLAYANTAERTAGLRVIAKSNGAIVVRAGITTGSYIIVANGSSWWTD